MIPKQPRFIQTVTGRGYRFVTQRQYDNHASAELLETVVSPSQAAGFGQIPADVAHHGGTYRSLSSRRWIADI